MLNALIAGCVAWWLLRIAPGAFTSARSAFSRVDLAGSVVLALLLWWTYWRAVDPTLVTVADLTRAHFVDAGGGIVTVGRYAQFMSIVLTTAAVFVFTGRFVCRRLQLFDVGEFASSDLGLFYFVGMATFLALFVPVARITAHAFASAAVVLALFTVATIDTLLQAGLSSRFRLFIAMSRARGVALLPIIVSAICLLQYVVTKRGGPMYDEFARYIATSNHLPLINRHFGQSALASLGLMVLGPGPDQWTFPRAFVNNWLFVSQLALVSLLYRCLRELSVSRGGAMMGVVMLMFGNSAISLMPHIMYDHDFPLIMNIYTDSLFGMAGVLILVLYLIDLQRAFSDSNVRPPSRWWPTLALPALIMAAFNYTAELDGIVMFLILGVLAVANAIRRVVPLIRLGSLVAVSLCSMVVAAAGGGVLSTKVVSRPDDRRDPFRERDAATARMSVRTAAWWYLPYIVPGFVTGFGNLPIPPIANVPEVTLDASALATASVGDSVNSKFLRAFREGKSDSWFKYLNVMYLLEMRASEVLKTLWFPLVGLATFGAVVCAESNQRMHSGSSAISKDLRLFWIASTTAFLAGLAVVFFANAVGGNALFWKWALTRAFEPGLCLAMICFVIVVDSWTAMFQTTYARRLIWAGLVLFMSFGTMFRILFYPSFNG